MRRCGGRCSTPACSSSPTARGGSARSSRRARPCASDSTGSSSRTSARAGGATCGSCSTTTASPPCSASRAGCRTASSRSSVSAAAASAWCPESRLTPLALPVLVAGRRLPACRPRSWWPAWMRAASCWRRPSCSATGMSSRSGPTPATSCARSSPPARGWSCWARSCPTSRCRMPCGASATRRPRATSRCWPSSPRAPRPRSRRRRGGRAPMPCCGGRSIGPRSKRRWPSSSSCPVAWWPASPSAAR